jgi:hypothetical protein
LTPRRGQMKTLDELGSFIALLKSKGFQDISAAPAPAWSIHDFWNPRTGLNVVMSLDFGRFGHLYFSRLKGLEVVRPEAGDAEVTELTKAFMGEHFRGPFFGHDPQVIHFVEEGHPEFSRIDR